MAAARATEVEAVLAGFRQANPEGRVYMVTLTVSHKASRALKSVWDGVAAGWQSVISGRAWQDEKAGHELEGFVRVFETTYGDNGWHVHVHALLLTRRALSVTEQKAWRLSMHDRWRHGIASERLVSSRRKGFDWKEVQGTGSLGQYFAKAVYEVTGASHKGARHGNVTPFGLLQFLATGEVPAGSDWLLDRDALELWREWEAGSKGRRQLTWSRGLRSRYLAEPEKSDEDLAAGEVDGETVAELPHPVYRRLAEAGRVPQMLLLARDDLPGLYSWLAALREPYSVPDRGRRWASSA